MNYPRALRGRNTQVARFTLIVCADRIIDARVVLKATTPSFRGT